MVDPVANVRLIVSMFEMGAWDNARITDLLNTLEQSPDELLPHAIGLVNQASYLASRTVSDRLGLNIQLGILRWQLLSGHDQESIEITLKNLQNLHERLDEEFSPEAVKQTALGSGTRSMQSWVYRKASGFQSGLSSGLPLSTFRGVLKQVDNARLNASGRLLFRDVYRRFGGDNADFTTYLAKLEHLLSVACEPHRGYLEREAVVSRRTAASGLPIVVRRHRRFAGGDGYLPRACYSSVCDDITGADMGTMCRELMEYVHPALPGWVFAVDAHDAAARPFLPPNFDPDALPYILTVLVAPENDAHRPLFEEAYRDFLLATGGYDSPVRVSAVMPNIREVEIGNVLDLRQPDAQQWLFETFRLGDGTFLSKPNGTDARTFRDMLPTLLHPELGGCPTTHAIGTWLRTAGSVDALIYPSARGSVGVTLNNGSVTDSFGWNIVDYRSAKLADLPAGEAVIDQTNWSGDDEWWGFAKRGVRIAEPRTFLGESPEGSWEVVGAQNHYNNLHAWARNLQRPGNAPENE
jgi:hypothetical protein